MDSLSEKAPALFHFARLLTDDYGINEKTIHQAKRVMADTLGTAFSGANSLSFRQVLKNSTSLFGSGNFPVWSTDKTTSLQGSVFFNTLSISLTDYDEGHRKAVGHPASLIIPAALAMAKHTNKPFSESLKATILGYEAGTRFSYARNRDKIKTWSTGRWGAIATASAAGYLLDLNTVQMVHALSMASVLSPAMLGGSGDVSTGSELKEGVPWAAQSGLQAAVLAKAGLTGPFLFLDESDDFDHDKLLQGFGDEWLINSNYFKPYACCRWLHTALPLAMRLKKQHNFSVDAIDRIEVRIFERALDLIINRHPVNVVQAQFHLPFALSCALIENEVTPRQMTEKKLHDRNILKLADKIVLIPNDEMSNQFPEKLPSQVTVFLHNGQQFGESAQNAPWDSGTSPSDQELFLKFAGQVGKNAKKLWDSIFDQDSELPL